MGSRFTKCNVRRQYNVVQDCCDLDALVGAQYEHEESDSVPDGSKHGEFLN